MCRGVLLSSKWPFYTERTCQGLGACRDGSPVAFQGGQLEALRSEWGARAQGDMWIESASSRGPTWLNVGVRAVLIQDMLKEWRRPQEPVGTDPKTGFFRQLFPLQLYLRGFQRGPCDVPPNTSWPA